MRYHIIAYYIIYFACSTFLNDLLISSLCFTFRDAILPISPITLIHHCCAAHENVPYRPLTTWSKTDQGPQLLCFEIHCHIGLETKFPMSCFKAMTECNMHTKAGCFL